MSVDHQHAGPPSALLVRALEHAAARQGAFHTARVQIDILRPIPTRRCRW